MEMKGHKSNYCEYCRDFHDPMQDYATVVRVGEVIQDYEFEAYHEGSIKTMKLSNFRGSWLVLMFYPADFTFVCPTELEDMARIYPELKKLGAEVVAFSTDTVFTHKAWHDTTEAIKQIAFPMGADPSGKIAASFGVLIEGGESALTADEGLAQRGTFVVDPHGVLRTMEIHDNSVGRSAKETLRKVQAAQFVDANPGKVCPANWEPGDTAIDPSKT
jgi:NADH-dependent peroxiredoxin subunit C